MIMNFTKWSRFYGVNLFLKILIDKFFVNNFYIINLPILIFCIGNIFRDGFPISYLHKIEPDGMEEDLKFIN